MNYIITKIEINSFRSIWKATLKADNINIFSGLNDVGKSNVLKAINLFFNNQTDFGTAYNFDFDYSKISLAHAQRSSKKKQQVKIKIYFKVPTSFKSLQGQEVWIERSFDRYGSKSETMSVTDSKKRSSITRLVNSVKYFYIPALKGPDVLRFILGEVGKRQLIKDEDIDKLNKQVNSSIKGLSDILAISSIQTETKFELPVLVEDFWQKLNINTKYDEFSELDKKINPSKKGNRDSLKQEHFQIPLQLRGDGVKSKFIPPLLQWIQEHEPKTFFVWGIDEPENSLEFKKAQEVADLYYSKYSKNIQLFLTSHSLAFIFSKGDNSLVFRCCKGEYGETKFENFDNLFKEKDKIALAEEVGALEIQKEVYEDWRRKSLEVENLTKEIERQISLNAENSRLLIITEGKNNEHIRMALKILDQNLLQFLDILDGAENQTGTQLKTVFNIISKKPSGHKILFVWDCDKMKDVSSLVESETVFKFCFPKNDDNTKVKNGIENLYPESIFTDECYNQRTEPRNCGGETIIKDMNKNRVIEIVKSKDDKEFFKNYESLVQKLLQVLETKKNL